MCQKHYEFYSQNPLTARFMAEAEALENKTAGWKLKMKMVRQSIIHYSLNLPMPLINHFPLEHVFLGEFYSMRNKEPIDSERIQQIIADFDIPENENLSDMRRRLNFRDIETSELGPREHYRLSRKDLPSKWPIVLSLIGLLFLVGFFSWFADPAFQIRGRDFIQLELLFWKYLPYLCALTLFIFLGLQIPSQYNYFVDRAYSMTLYKDVRENADLVNQVKFVKERRTRSGSYYASILGSVNGSALIIFISLLGHGSPITWKSILFCLAVVLAVVPLVYAYAEMVLYFPVVEALKKKRITIDLYNADHRGGLKAYHLFLYRLFLFNEGLALVIASIYLSFPISKWWLLLFMFLLLPRFNHAGWAMVGWARSVADFNREKRAEKSRLSAMEGSADNMGKMELLDKTHPVGLIPLLKYAAVSILIPYMLSQLPKWPELLEWIKSIL